MPTVAFEGRIITIDTVADTDKAVQALSGEKFLGIDTETRPSFRVGVSYKVGLLQLSTPETCYLFRLSHIRLDNRILKILGARHILKVGADVSGDIRSLHALRNFHADGFVDLQVEASRWGIEEKSLRKLSAIVLGMRVSKAQRLSNWEAEILTDQQCEYAATDAWVCVEILNKLQSTEPKSEPLKIISVAPQMATPQPQHHKHPRRRHRRPRHTTEE